MFKGFLLVTLLLCLASSQGNTWNSWNSYATANPTIVAAYNKPAKPAGFTRWTDTTATQSSYANRANQYKYTINLALSGSVCNVYCGPRSFLTTDVRGNIVCQRDLSFWNNLPGHGPICIPDADAVCSQVESTNVLGSVGACNMLTYSFVDGYSGYECCYNDANQNTYAANNLTKRSVASPNLYALRKAESPVSS
jgi:hypothetical protein